MAKTRKILEINDGGVHLMCIKHCGETNPFRLYRVWWDRGEHRKEITRYGDLVSATYHIYDIAAHEWSETMSEREGVDA